ncbi:MULTISPECIES: hypothetical protein [unclassified Streptomyces]|uniref:hypothetical protein n=1 Tax=unclassified Streptomyces TaxID=2593676 RepID=UPI0018FE7684|nr:MULTISPECIES: hypothetical protein [unclassified Streptomyces]
MAHGPESLDRRLALYGEEQRTVFGADTYRAHAQMLSTEGSDVRDAWLTRMRDPSPTVVSSTPQGPLDWPDATVVNGDAVDAVARLENSGDLLRAASHGPALEDSSHPPGRPDQRQVPDEVDRRPDHGEVCVDQRAAGLGERVQSRERLVLRGAVAERHRAQREGRHRKAGTAQKTVFHGQLPRWIR